MKENGLNRLLKCGAVRGGVSTPRAVAYRATTTQVVVRGSVEETLNALLDAEADRLCNAQRYKERN